MQSYFIGSLIGILILLILLSAFFSSAETSFMSINRYRLKHKALAGDKKANLVLTLLNQMDSLLSTILLGNNFVNLLASSLATTLALQAFGESGLIIAIFILTVIILIFGEITPKMIATIHSEKIALNTAWILQKLIILLTPFTASINKVSICLLRLFKIKHYTQSHDHLNAQELKTLVSESGNLLPKKRQGMLLGVLDLEFVDVEDIMIPRTDIIAINLNDPIALIKTQFQNIQYTRLPIYSEDTNNILGFIHMRDISQFLVKDTLTKENLIKIMNPAYYIPEGTPLHTQLYNFQHEKCRIAFIVDEYGDIQGLITLEDILEEIVGKFTTDAEDFRKEIIAKKDGSFIVPGNTNIRDINKKLGWTLPLDGPNTLNGLIIERLESIPDGRLCLLINQYCLEILTLSGNTVNSVKITIHTPKSTPGIQ
ncbi:MAG: HlyC/CorC family transporter [Endozoicomonadaceae bacterium]|nr:HlyC/CorC family transporter [Endozoicomonadaceae bacterium]